MTHRQRTARIAALTAVAALALSGCAAGSETEEAADADTTARADTLRLGVVQPLVSFAPWQANWANQAPYLQAVYDTLLISMPDGSLEPGLATDWEWNDERTELTLNLRDDVVFSNGEDLTAETVAGALERFRDGTSEQAALFDDLVSAEAVDEDTVLATLASPDPAFLVYLAQAAGVVAAQELWDSPDAQTTPIGSGPYTLDQAATVVGSTYVYEARDDYWEPERVHYDEIVMTIYNDQTALLNALKGGQIDATSSQSPSQIAEAEAAGYVTHLNERNWNGFVLADRDGTLHEAFGDVRVRQAINHAFDREGMVDAMAAGHGTPTTQVFHSAMSAYDPALDERYPYDVELAKELLAEAGYADGFTFTMPSSDFVAPATTALIDQQLADIGITVEREMTGDDLFGKLQGGSYAAFTMLLGTQPTAWQQLQFNLLPQAPWNPFSTEDATVEELAQTIRLESVDESSEAARELNEYVVEQAWFAPFFREQTAFFATPETLVEVQTDNAYPNIWDIRPRS